MSASQTLVREAAAALRLPVAARTARAAARARRMTRSPFLRMGQRFGVDPVAVRAEAWRQRCVAAERGGSADALAAKRPGAVADMYVERRAAASRRAAQAALLATAEFWLAQKCGGTARRADVRRNLGALEFCGFGGLRRSVARLIVECVRHTLLHRRRRAARWERDHRSASGSLYATRGDMRLRLSDHSLGFADYGSREQVHFGPEVVFSGRETWAEAHRLVIDATSAWLAE